MYTIHISHFVKPASITDLIQKYGTHKQVSHRYHNFKMRVGIGVKRLTLSHLSLFE